jgi:hypothetical protein
MADPTVASVLASGMAQPSKGPPKVWIAQPTACPNCKALHGKVVSVIPPMHPSCKCQLA